MIHRDFFSQYEKISHDLTRSNDSRTASDVMEVNSKLMSAGFSGSRNIKISTDEEHGKLSRAFDYYKRYLIDAPGYRFITKDQVVELCKKYGLVWGNTGYFIGDIPRENAAHIAQFRVNPTILVNTRSVYMWNDTLVTSMDDNHLINSFIWTCGKSMDRGWHQHMMGRTLSNHTAELFKEMERRFICNVRTIPTGHDMYDRQTIKTSLVEQTKSLDHITMQTRNMVVIHTYQVPGLEEILTAAMRPVDVHGFDLTKVTFKIVANKEMFDLKDRIINMDREIIDADVPVPPKWDRPDFNDPIVLAEVEGGYLIVTAWGSEAGLDEVVNFKNN